MLVINPLVINEIDNKVLRDYLKKYSKQKKGETKSEWLKYLIESNELDVKEFKKFLFNELMYGTRRYIRVYKLANVRYIKKAEDWTDYLSRYGMNSLCCNKILETNPDDASFKIAATDNEKDEYGDLSKIFLIYVKSIKVSEKSVTSKIYTYLPVEIDLKKKLISIKVHNRNGIINENNRPEKITESLLELIQAQMNIKPGMFKCNPAEVLYRMSNGLIDDFFNKIPTMNKLNNLENKIDSFINDVLTEDLFKNKEIIKHENKDFYTLNDSVMDLESEIKFLLQQAVVFDYFFDKEISVVLDELDVVLVCLRFNDRDNVTASLTGENRRKALFDSKTLMSLRRSMDLVKSLSYITIYYRNEDGIIMKVKYDASNPDYLGIHVLNYNCFTEREYKRIWEIYGNYESDNDENVGELPSKKVG